MSFFSNVPRELAKTRMCGSLVLDSQGKVGKKALLFLAAEVSFAVSWQLGDGSHPVQRFCGLLSQTCLCKLK